MVIHNGSPRKLIHVIGTIFSTEHQIRIPNSPWARYGDLKYFTKVMMFKLNFEGFHQLENKKHIQEETA